MADSTLYDTGERDLPVLVCLHSLFLDPTSFDELVSVGHGRCRILRPTFPGQGARTGEVSATVTMDDCVNDVIATLGAAGVDRYALLGQSMGGDVAVRIAAAHPEAVQALILVGSSARAEPEDQRAAFGSVCDHMEVAGFDTGLQETILGIMLGATTRANPDKSDLVASFSRQISSLPAALCHASRGVVERGDASDLLGSISAPTLVINGTDDVARPPDWSADVVRRIPGALHTQLDGVGHSPTQEAPDTVIPLILNFVETHVGSR